MTVSGMFSVPYSASNNGCRAPVIKAVGRFAVRGDGVETLDTIPEEEWELGVGSDGLTLAVGGKTFVVGLRSFAEAWLKRVLASRASPAFDLKALIDDELLPFQVAALGNGVASFVAVVAGLTIANVRPFAEELTSRIQDERGDGEHDLGTRSGAKAFLRLVCHRCLGLLENVGEGR